ncbi:hypothetical protein [Pelagibacterium montanilacus]|uniref:hypothetical protein n=1 Tax=Pelagibacterium montanilacus TaxID=2185280 RepID=UPI000F8F3A91|nr:hypothetical protein [Pelagibacterium montanilacus]
MLDIPEIVAAPQSPLLTIPSHRLGGSAKSFMSQILVDAGHRSGLDLKIFENDSQRFYDPYASVQHILFPPTDVVVHDPIADVRVHSVLDRALLEAGPNDCLIYDTSAASINRLTFVMDQLDVALRLVAMERHALIVVPTSAREDIARDALETYEVWRDLLPAPHRVVPAVSQRDGDIHTLPAGHDLRKLLKVAEDGAFLMPQVPMTIIDGIRRSGLMLFRLGDSRNPLETAEMAKKMGMDPTLVQMMRRAAGTILSETDEQMRRLGFILGL